MYIEKNGYVVMKKDEMSFIDETIELTDEIEEALVYSSYQDAEQTAKELNEDEPSCYEVINYHQTIWLDKMGITKESCCCCKNKEIEGQLSINDIDNFGIPMKVLNEVKEEKEEVDELLQGLIKENKNG